jgi:hypothetical protein
MSVTVTIEAVHTGDFEVYCYGPNEEHDRQVIATFPNWDETLAFCIEHKTVCAGCNHYGTSYSAIMDIDAEALEVNMANGNATMLGALIGFDFGEELCGSCDPDVLLGHVLIHMALPNVKLAAHKVIMPNGSTWVDADFDASRYLPRLADLCIEAKRLGRSITWS